MQADATLLANYSRHCGMLHVASVSHPVVCCYMFLRVIGSCCAKVESGQTFGPATPNILLFRDRRSVGPKNVGSVCTALPTLLGPRTRISHTWSPKSYGLYPSHDALQVPTLLGVVASFCTPLPTRTQQQWCLHTTANTNSTTLNIVGANNVGSCCIRLHTTVNTNSTTLNIVGANNVGSCCIRLHTTANTNSTTLNIVGANNVGSCCIRLHTTVNTNSTTLNIVEANNVERCCTRLHTTTNTNATTLNIESEERSSQ